MKLIPCYQMLAVIFAACMAAIILGMVMDGRRSLFASSRLCAALAGAGSAALLAALLLAVAMTTARAHGMYDYGIDVRTMLSGIMNTPEEDDLPEDVSSSLLLFYRFTCGDCERLYPELDRAFRGYGNAYWVSSKSNQGERILKDFPIKEVPTAIYFDKDSQPHIYALYERKDGGLAVCQESVDRLLYLLQTGA